MDVTGGAHLASVVVVSGGAASGGGGPAPFLLKTYEMVDDPATDEVVSWSDASEASFVVWNPQEFSAQLLPTYFKHNNFSSFIRQLNTYGFRKIDLERWEFSNEHFVRGQKHLLKNIHRRKPIHSHSHQPSALPDNERAILEDEIYRLTQEKNALHADLRKFEQHQSGAVTQIEDLERRVLAIEQRQLKMITFLQQASKNPCFIDMLVKIAEASSAFTDTFHKKRRLPGVDYCNEATEISSYDDHSSTSKPEIGNILNQQFYDKLKLGLCSTMTESNFMAASTHSSHEDNGSRHGKHVECEIIRMDCLPLVPQMLEHYDTGTSFGPSRNSSFARAIHDEGILPCHLNLTLASCSMEIDRSHISNANGSTADQGPDNPVDTTSAVEKEDDIGRLFCDSHKASGDSGPTVVTTSQEDAEAAGGAPAAPPAVVNDKFWEQFLTERPGCPDTEDTSSNIRRDFSREHVDDKKQAHEDTSNDSEYVKQLKL